MSNYTFVIKSVLLVEALSQYYSEVIEGTSSLQAIMHRQVVKQASQPSSTVKVKELQLYHGIPSDMSAKPVCNALITDKEVCFAHRILVFHFFHFFFFFWPHGLEQLLGHPN
jgi:hypothetical protein